jgi:hypothetical protein
MKRRAVQVLLAFGLGISAATAGEAPFPCGDELAAGLARAEAKAAAADSAFKAKPHLSNRNYQRMAGLNPAWLANYRKYYAIRNQATNLETTYFGEGNEGDEGDAYRHYLGTLLLARKVGLKQAYWIPRLHDSGQYDIQSMMDKYNNALSLAYAKKHLGELKALDVNGVGKLAFTLLPSSGVVVVRPKTKDYCGNFPAFFRWLDGTLR